MFPPYGARLLELLISNEKFLVNASHQLALITSLPLVHTARRTYRLNVPVRPWDLESGRLFDLLQENYHHHHPSGMLTKDDLDQVEQTYNNSNKS